MVQSKIDTGLSNIKQNKKTVIHVRSNSTVVENKNYTNN
jgi:hypothetical protein